LYTKQCQTLAPDATSEKSNQRKDKKNETRTVVIVAVPSDPRKLLKKLVTDNY
jgi:hypothetical protein